MEIEMTWERSAIAFGGIAPAGCFIWKLDKGDSDSANVWMKLSQGGLMSAVNLSSGLLVSFPELTLCIPVDAKVVVE